MIVAEDHDTAIGGTGRDTFGADVFAEAVEDIAQVAGLVADVVRGEDRLASMRDRSQGETTWYGLTTFDSNRDVRVAAADTRADLQTITHGGVARSSLVLHLPREPEDPTTLDMKLYGVTTLSAADFVTSGARPWA